MIAERGSSCFSKLYYAVALLSSRSLWDAVVLHAALDQLFEGLVFYFIHCIILVVPISVIYML